MGFVKIVCALLMLQVVRAQVPLFGRCPQNVETVQDLNADAYAGRWYEYAKYPFIFEINTKCNYAQYGILQNNSISVYNYAQNRLTGNPVTIKGVADVVGAGKLKVSFPNAPIQSGGDGNYWVLGTDYTNYAVVYSCTELLGILHADIVWILTRERSPSDETIAAAKNVVVENGLPLSYLIKTSQNDCADS